VGRLKAPREAAGQMDLLTVPSHDGADLMSNMSRRLYQPPLATANQGPTYSIASIPKILADETGARWRERETHGVMPNPRQVPSEGQRLPSRKDALCKGFETMMT
jgi:hypothetical protein